MEYEITFAIGSTLHHHTIRFITDAYAVIAAQRYVEDAYGASPKWLRLTRKARSGKKFVVLDL